MSIDYNNIVFAEVDLNFNTDQFTKEFDQRILPFTEPFVAIQTQWAYMPHLNKYWNIIPNDKFEEYDKIIKDGGTDFHGMTHYWKAVNLMRGATGPKNGVGAGWRSMHRFSNNQLKDQFKDLEIVNWIHDNVPAKRIVGIHCVTVEEGEFATIHRDAYWHDKSAPNPALKNGFFKEGFIVLCLNITNGGVPLLWAMDHEKTTPHAIDAKCYIGNDYFIHGVPITSSRRRQIRISFEPSAEFYKLIKNDTVRTVPDDYEYK